MANHCKPPVHSMSAPASSFFRYNKQASMDISKQFKFSDVSRNNTEINGIQRQGSASSLSLSITNNASMDDDICIITPKGNGQHSPKYFNKITNYFSDSPYNCQRNDKKSKIKKRVKKSKLKQEIISQTPILHNNFNNNYGMFVNVHRWSVPDMGMYDITFSSDEENEEKSIISNSYDSNFDDNIGLSLMGLNLNDDNNIKKLNPCTKLAHYYSEPTTVRHVVNSSNVGFMGNKLNNIIPLNDADSNQAPPPPPGPPIRSKININVNVNNNDISNTDNNKKGSGTPIFGVHSNVPPPPIDTPVYHYKVPNGFNIH